MGQIKHVFSNAVADDPLATSEVRPSDWNSNHAYTMQDAVSFAGNTAGALANVSSGTLILAGGNNITLSQNGNNVTISAANAGGAQTGISGIIVSDASYTSGTVSFSNQANITIGSSVNGATQYIRLSGNPAQTTQSAIKGFGASNTGNTAGNTGLSTGIDWVLAGSNNVTISQSTAGGGPNTLWVSGPALNAFLTTAGLSQDSSKYAGTGFTTATTAGTNLVGTLNTAGISMGVPAWLTAAGGGNNLTVQDSATTLQVTKVIYSNLNGVSFGLSTAASLATVTASVAAQTNQTVGLYATGNTTNNSSTTFDARTAGTWNALGAMTLGFSNGSVQVSAPATSSIVGTSGIAISTNGSTISVYPVARTRLIYPDGNLTAVSAPTNASQTFRYLPVFDGMTGTRIDALISMSAGSAATTATAALAFSVYAAIYTRNGSTLSSLSSGSTQTTYSYASNSAGQTQLISAAIRPMSVPVNFNMIPGEYYIGFNLLTNTSSIGASTTNLGLTMSMMGGNQLQTAANYAEITAATATSVGLHSGMGVYSVASTGLLSGVSLSGINQTGSALSAANIALVFRNA